MLSLMDLLEQLRRLARERADSLGRGGHKKVAEVAKIHPTNLSAFLSGQRGLSVESAYDLAKAVGYVLQLVPAPPAKPAPRKRKA